MLLYGYCKLISPLRFSWYHVDTRGMETQQTIETESALVEYLGVDAYVETLSYLVWEVT